MAQNVTELVQSNYGAFFHVLDDEDLASLHEILLAIYIDISSVCERYGFRLILGGGSALGAIRHNGFIPWDDDIDLIMLRDEYDKFLDIFDKELSDKYYLLAPNSKNGANCFVARIMKKGTTFLSMFDVGTRYPHCVYVDICPVDYASNIKLIRYLKGFLADSLRFISYSVYWCKYQNVHIRMYMNFKLKTRLYYNFRLFIGMCFSCISYKKWFDVFDKFIRGKESNFLTIAAGRKKYYKETLKKDVFIPPRRVIFETTVAYVPNNYDLYLRNLYNEYMIIPAIDKHEVHICVEFK